MPLTLSRSSRVVACKLGGLSQYWSSRSPRTHEMKMDPRFRRRTLVKAIAASALIPLLGSNLIGCSDNSKSSGQPPVGPAIQAEFLHGVASGDPLGDKVIIWTRVSPESEARCLSAGRSPGMRSSPQWSTAARVAPTPRLTIPSRSMSMALTPPRPITTASWSGKNRRWRSENSPGRCGFCGDLCRPFLLQLPRGVLQCLSRGREPGLRRRTASRRLSV